MMDIAHKNTDKKIKKLESQIESIYQEALVDIDHKLNDFAAKYKVKETIHLQELKDGKITQKQFDAWKKGQVFQGKQWEAKRDQIISTIHNSNSIATKIINGSVVSVFATNANYMSYSLEHDTGINFGFGVYDNATVVKLIKDNPDVLPKWKINEQKDYTWNKKKVNNSITQGVIQGERLDQIVKRISQGLVAQNENTMKTFARTAMTGAQNAGRDQSLMDAKSKGINVVKQWMATLDGRTRDSHRHMDGETIKVKDIWHPTKFSNGCRYPGDPEGPAHEVYNCRCTMVGDVQDYPSIYERYDNVDGKPIKNMSYAEWYKTKYGKDLKPLKPKPSNKIDYAKYGGKEVYDILSKYDSFDGFLIGTTSGTYSQFQKVVDAFDGDNEAIKNAIKEINTLKKAQPVKKAVPKLTAEEKAQKKYEKAKADLDKIEQEIKDKGADKVFEDIWKNQKITYADYEAKKHTIIAKEQFYEGQIEQFKKNFYKQIDPDESIGKEIYDIMSKYDYKGKLKEDKKFIDLIQSIGLDKEDIDDLWTMQIDVRMNVKKMQTLLDDLKEFEKNGEAFSKLLAKRDTMMQTVSSLKPKPDPSKIFDVDAYSQQRKNAALWAKNSEQADKALRTRTGEVWRGATEDEKDAIFEYTDSYSKFNEPLRGWEYGQANYNTGDGFKGVGNTDLNAGHTNNGKRLNAMTDIIDKCSYDQDVWLQRGCKFNGMDKFFNCDMDLLKNGSQEELEKTLLGTMPTEYGFMSCGSSKGRGFSGNIMLNIYAPEGTKMMYVEPFSAFGNGAASIGWDGLSSQSSLGSELETILQQGTQFRVTKIEKSNDKLYFDLEVINQDHQQRWT